MNRSPYFILLISFLLLLFSAFQFPEQAGPDPKAIIARYIEALGGKARFDQVNDLTIVLEVNMGNDLLEITKKIKVPNKEVTIMKRNGEVQEVTVFTGEELISNIDGVRQAVTQYQTREAYYDSFVLPELKYDELGVKYLWKGTQELDGETTDILEVTFPFGKVQRDYFSRKTGLKVKTENISPDPNRSDNQSWIYKDYKAVEGILFPYVQIIPATTNLPQVLTGYVTYIGINTGLKDRDFKVK